MLDTTQLVQAIKTALAEAERKVQVQIDALVREQQAGKGDAELEQLYAAAIAALEKVKEQSTRPTRERLARELLSQLQPLGLPLSMAEPPERASKKRRKRTRQTHAKEGAA